MTDPRNGDVVVDWLATTDVVGDGSSPLNLTRGYCGLGVSSDGGKTWSTKPLPWAELTQTVNPPSPLPPVGPVPGVAVGPNHDQPPICGDPVLGVSQGGTIYAGAAQVGSPSFEQDLVSTNDGWSWSDPTEPYGVDQTVAGAPGGLQTSGRPPIGEGRAYMAVDPQTGVVSWNSQEDGAVEGRFLVVSTDDGQTWSTPEPLDPDVQSASAGPQSSAFGVIGVVYNIDETSNSYKTSASQIPCPGTETQCTVFETTTAAQGWGLTWTRHFMPVVDQSSSTAGGLYSGVSSVAADPTKPGHFAVLSSVGANFEIWVTSNSGNTWAKTEVIAPPKSSDQFGKPGIAYSRNGALGVVWRTVYPAGDYDVSAIVSRDGGTRWSDVVLLTKLGPAPDNMADELPGDDGDWGLDMDTTSLNTVWGDARTGIRQLWFARLNYTNLTMNP
ncbi:MAG TPA: sialidase family protein [Acidimicrobiales bacterium]|nr:sialidase family protein [Acidimicrobiales bacterium]